MRVVCFWFVEAYRPILWPPEDVNMKTSAYLDYSYRHGDPTCKSGFTRDIKGLGAWEIHHLLQVMAFMGMKAAAKKDWLLWPFWKKKLVYKV